MKKRVVYLIGLSLLFFQFCNNGGGKGAESVKEKEHFKKNDSLGLIKDSSLVYEGSWFWKSEDSSSTFKIVLWQKADTIYGKYCAAYDFGNRMDCDFDTTILNLRGMLHQDSILIYFNSFYGAENGISSIKRKGDALLWSILKYPQGGDCFAPQNAVLYKKIKNW